MIRKLLWTGLLVWFFAGCALMPGQTMQVEVEKAVPAPAIGSDNAALIGSDLFPAKANLRHARAFKVEYHDTYKIVTVLQPWRDAKTIFTYFLVQRGTTPPDDVGDAQVIEIPVRRMASLAATHLPYLDEINRLDALTAVANPNYINTPGVVARLQSGAIKAVGNGPDVNIESLLDLNPEVVTTLALGNVRKDDYQLLMQKDFKVVIVSDFMEETPLGRAEWVKFMALFFNQEAQAEQVFNGIEERYEKIRTLAAGVRERPTVLMGYEINGVWNMPGGKGYQAAYVRDAGGQYLWEADETSGRIPLSFEAVLEKGVNADFWFDQSVSWKSAMDVLAADPRFEIFNAFSQGNTYNNNARLNTAGGNDYNESGHANPDVVLADLISILHPEILPDHALVYYRPLRPKEE